MDVHSNATENVSGFFTSDLIRHLTIFVKYECWSIFILVVFNYISCFGLHKLPRWHFECYLFKNALKEHTLLNLITIQEDHAHGALRQVLSVMLVILFVDV